MKCANYNNPSCPKTQIPTKYVAIRESDLSDFSQFDLTSSHSIPTMNVRALATENAKLFELDDTCKQGLINFSQPKGFITIPIQVFVAPFAGKDIILLTKT